MLRERLVAVKVHLRLSERGLVTNQLAVGLGEGNLSRARIDLSEQGSFPHELPFVEINLHQLSVDSAADNDGVQRGNGSQRVEVVLRGSTSRGSYVDNRQNRRYGSLLSLCLGLLLSVMANGEQRKQEHQGANYDPEC